VAATSINADSGTQLKPDPENIPDEMKTYAHWVVFEVQPKPNGKLDKIPYNPTTGVKASHSDSRTWVTFDKAWAAFELGEWDGIGFVFSSGDPFVGIDFDACRNPDTGEIDPEVQAALDSLDGYAEVSLSGTGVHAIVRAKIEKPRRGGGVEIYECKRFFVMTGKAL
jgi:putative DNA primase/helicase